MAFTIVFLFALCFPFVNALAYDAAKVTGHGHNQILDAKGWTPAPTTAPRVPHELLKRQSRTSLRGLGSTVLLADSNTCGFYEDGFSTYDYKCLATRATCQLRPAIAATALGVIECCNSGTCGALAIDCVNSAEYSSVCGPECQSETLTYKCTNHDLPYCQTIVMDDVSVRDFQCVSRNSLPDITIYTTTGRLAINYRTVILTESSTSTPSTSTTKSTTESSTSSSSSTSFPATSSTSTPEPTTSSKPTPVGPIIGGSVGGFVVLAIVGFGIFFLINQRRKDRDHSAGQMDYSQTQPIQSPPIYIPHDNKSSAMHTQQPVSPVYGDRSSATSPISHSGGGRDSYMSGPGFDSPYSTHAHEMAVPSTGGR